MEEALIRRLKQHGVAGDTFSIASATTSVKFVANASHAIETKLGKGLGLRVINGGRIGFSSTSNYAKQDELLAAALATSRFGDEARFELPPPAEFPCPKTADERVRNLTTEAIVATGEEIIDRFRQQEPDAKFDLQLSKSVATVRLVNTRGTDVRFDVADYGLSLAGLVIVDSSLVWVYDFLNLSSGEPPDLGSLISRNCDLFRRARTKARLESKKYPALVMPLAVPDFLAGLLPGVSGKTFQKGISPLIGKEKTEVLDRKLTVFDDGLVDFGAASAPFDGDGLPKRRLPLFENGVFQNFLFDLQTGASVGRPSTGSAQRGYGSLPSPGPNNLVVPPGKARFEDTLASIREGVLINAVVGGGQSNLLAGDFSLNVSLGYKIENGAIAGRVKDVMVAGNIYEAGRELEDLGTEATDLGNYHLPFFWFKNLSFAAKD